jgi:uncharacterized protein DUF481
MKPTTYSLLLLSLFFCLPAQTNAQIVNIESARMQSDTVGWMGKVGAAFAFRKNTQKILETGVEAHFQYKTSRDLGLWLFLGNFSMLKVGDSRFTSDGLVHIRYNRKVNEWLRWEWFTQYQNNYITQIDARVLAGTGPRFKLIKTNVFRLYAGTMLMYEWEKELTTPTVDHHDIRNSDYISFTWLPRESIEMISTTYFQPLLRKFSDYRFMCQIAFKVKATPHFSMAAKWNYLHDRFPAGTAPRTTYVFATGFEYEL